MLEHTKTTFNLAILLDNTCSNPDNFEEWNDFREKEEVRRTKEVRDISGPDFVPRPFPGYMRYTIDTHCTRFVIVARRRKDGTYQIKDVLAQAI